MSEHKEVVIYKTKNGEVLRCICDCCLKIRFYNLYWKISFQRLPVFRNYIYGLTSFSGSPNEINDQIMIAMEEDTMAGSLPKHEIFELYDLLQKSELEIKRELLEKIFQS